VIDPEDVGPRRWPVVTFDPGVGWGRATMHGIHTDAIAERYWASGNDAAVCADYGLTRHELAVALWYEAVNGTARREYAGWVLWAEKVAYPRLAGWVKPLDIDSLPLPPGRAEKEETR